MPVDNVYHVITISIESCTNETVLVKDIAFRLLMQGRLSGFLLSLKSLAKYYQPDAAILD